MQQDAAVRSWMLHTQRHIKNDTIPRVQFPYFFLSESEPIRFTYNFVNSPGTIPIFFSFWIRTHMVTYNFVNSPGTIPIFFPFWIRTHKVTYNFVDLKVWRICGAWMFLIQLTLHVCVKISSFKNADCQNCQPALSKWGAPFPSYQLLFKPKFY